MRSFNRGFTVLGSLGLAILAGCGTEETTAPDCDAIAAALVSRIEVRPATATVNLGDSVLMEAAAFSCARQLDGVGALQWRSGDPSVATVNGAGWVTAVTAGTVAVYAVTQGKEGSASLTTQLMPVARVVVEPTAATVGVGRTGQLTARAFDAGGREIAGRPVLWTTANADIVSVTSRGDITGASAGGPIAVAATVGGKSAAAKITVMPAAVASVLVTPTASTMAAATTALLTATLRDELGNVLTDRAVAWSSSDPTIASIASEGGHVTGIRPGRVTITAASEGRTGNAEVAIELGSPAALRFVQQPSPVQAGSAITPAVTIEIQDAAGNRVTTATSAVTITLAPSSAATLGGTRTMTAVNGLAGFSGLTVSGPGTYSLRAVSAGLAGVTSTTFQVTERPAARLAFVQQPASAMAGGSLGPITVEVQDATGSRVGGGGASITLTIETNPGGGALSATHPQTTVAGLAIFPGLSINRTGTGYRLAASAAGLEAVKSTAFNVTAGPASRLTFVVDPCPGGCVVNTVLFPAPRVLVEDSLGNTVTSSAATVAVTLLGGQGNSLLNGTTSARAVAGVVTFGDLAVSRIATDLTLRAASELLTPDTSAAFTISNPGPDLVFTTQPPSSVAAGATLPAVRVQLLDTQGEALATSGIPVTVALGPSGTFSGTKTQTTDGTGIATFSDLSVTAPVGMNYTFTATAPTFPSAISSAFAVTASSPSRLTFTRQPPASVTVGEPVSPPVTVQLRDAGGNPVLQPGITVSLAMSGGTLAGASTSTNPSGLATFTGLTATATAGAGYALTANSTGLASATSDSFAVVGGAATHLVFVTAPGNGTKVGERVAPTVEVEVRDGSGARVATSTTTVTLILITESDDDPEARLTGHVVVASAGLAQFPDLRVSKKGTGYRLVATAPGLGSATSQAFRIR